MLLARSADGIVLGLQSDLKQTLAVAAAVAVMVDVCLLAGLHVATRSSLQNGTINKQVRNISSVIA